MGRLLAAIHDVSPRTESAVDALRDHLGAQVPAGRMAMLVVPDHWGEAPIVPGSPFARRLRAWADEGVEMFVHGWFHQDRSRHDGVGARAKARFMTAGEGEFLGLDYQASRRLMIDGKALIEDIIGRPSAGFIAPAWLYGPGARAALADCGFRLAEDHMRVWSPVTGTVLCRGPVITWASRSRARIASSLLAARLLPLALGAAPVVRVAVHPGDTGVPALMASIAATLRRLCRTHVPGCYADLTGDGSQPCAS